MEKEQEILDSNRMIPDGRPGFLVIAQTHADSFLPLLERLAEGLGPGELWTGMASARSVSSLCVRRGPSYPQKRGLGPRALSWCTFCFWVLGQALCETKRKRPLLVITNPPVLPHLALVLSCLSGRPFSLMIWDVYPDHLVHSGLCSEENLLVRAWRNLNQRAYARARSIITLSDQMKAAVEDHAKGGGVRVLSIPFWVDAERVRPRDRRDNLLASEWELGEAPVVLYAGNIGKTHSLTTLVGAASALGQKAQFLIVGHGLGREDLEREARDRGLSNLRFFDPVSTERLGDLLSLGDIAIVSQAKESAHLSLPSKTFSAMAAGSALLAITPVGSDLDALVQRFACGISVPPDDPSATLTALQTLLNDPSRRLKAQENARQAAEDHFAQTIVHSQIVRELVRAFSE